MGNKKLTILPKELFLQKFFKKTINFNRAKIFCRINQFFKKARVTDWPITIFSVLNLKPPIIVVMFSIKQKCKVTMEIKFNC